MCMFLFALYPLLVYMCVLCMQCSAWVKSRCCAFLAVTALHMFVVSACPVLNGQKGQGWVSSCNSSREASPERDRDLFLQNPSSAPSALLTIKSGSIFAKSAAVDDDIIPPHASVSQVSSDVVKGVCSTLQADLTEEVWLKLQKKHKDCKQRRKQI